MVSSTTTKPSLSSIYACLPFLEIEQDTTIQCGPVLFWPASQAKQHLSSASHDSFFKYLENIHLPLQSTTCVSISEDIPSEVKDFVLVDSVYLLYFACTFRSLYYNTEVPHLNAFRKLIPASESFIKTPSNWSHIQIDSSKREQTVCIHLVDQDICQALGSALEAVYINPQNLPKEKVENYKRLIRAIRYFVDRFFDRFVNLLGQGLELPETLFEPEDIIFLASSFEALLNISGPHPTSDFKQKVRPMLHLKYSRPLETFWKWADGFYDIKRKIIYHGDNPDPFFRANKNFVVSFVYVGIKLFIYSIYYTLFQYKLIPSEELDLSAPPDFKWLHPEELILFFWTEENLLRKITLSLSSLTEQPNSPEYLLELRWLSNLYHEMFTRYYLRKSHHEDAAVEFFASARAEIEKEARAIIDYSRMTLPLSNSSELNLETLLQDLIADLRVRTRD